MAFEFLKKYFASSKDDEAINSRQDAVTHEGHTIVPTPKNGQGGWTTEGLIEREVDGETKSHHFIRAEKHVDREQAVSYTILKGQRIIDEEIRMKVAREN